jgi:hypothetical protein
VCPSNIISKLILGNFFFPNIFSIFSFRSQESLTGEKVLKSFDTIVSDARLDESEFLRFIVAEAESTHTSVQALCSRFSELIAISGGFSRPVIPGANSHSSTTADNAAKIEDNEGIVADAAE